MPEQEALSRPIRKRRRVSTDAKSPLRDAERDLRVVADGLDHAESVAWESGFLWAGTEAGQLVRIDPISGAWEIAAETGGCLLGLAFDAVGRCYACDSASGRVLRITPGGAVETYADAVCGRRLITPNYAAFSSDGTLWVTESGRMGADDGFLFAIPPSGEPQLSSDDCMSFPNGIAFAPGEQTLYLVESRTARVLGFTRHGTTLSAARVVATLPRAVPDGVVVDQAGSVYVTCFQPNRVYLLGNGDPALLFLDDWSGLHLLAPTNGCFGGESLKTLFLTSFGWHTISAIDVDVPGILPARPAL
jgi:gluconolactonase